MNTSAANSALSTNAVILSDDAHNQSTVILSEVAHRATQPKDPCISPEAPPRVPHPRREAAGWGRTLSLTATILLFAFLFTTSAHAQGCAQCLDSTRATPPAVQAAYRHAIELLGGVAVTLFLAALILLRREP